MDNDYEERLVRAMLALPEKEREEAFLALYNSILKGLDEQGVADLLDQVKSMVACPLTASVLELVEGHQALRKLL